MASTKRNSKAILWQNVEKLMVIEYGKENLWQFCKKVGIGAGTGTRIKEQETSVGIDVLEQIAEAFDLQPWHLLVPDLEPGNPPLALISETEKKFYESMRASASYYLQQATTTEERRKEASAVISLPDRRKI